MKIQTFDNGKGLIHGFDPKRIGCDKEGVLKIGTVEVNISTGNDSIMPLLFNGCSGSYNATFTDKAGITYELAKVEIKEGRIVPPHPMAVELMDLRCRIEAIEKICTAMDEQIDELSHIFDTDALNFLIK